MFYPPPLTQLRQQEGQVLTLEGGLNPAQIGGPLPAIIPHPNPTSFAPHLGSCKHK
jgi:hypothetical protein